MQHHEEQTMEQIVRSLGAEVDQKLHDLEVRWLNDLQVHEDRRQRDLQALESRRLNDLQVHEDRRQRYLQVQEDRWQAQQSEIQALKQKLNRGMYTLVLKTSSLTLLTSKSLAWIDLWPWWGF